MRRVINKLKESEGGVEKGIELWEKQRKEKEERRINFPECKGVSSALQQNPPGKTRKKGLACFATVICDGGQTFLADDRKRTSMYLGDGDRAKRKAS